MIYDDVILPLARSWREDEIRNTIKDYLTVLKPEVWIVKFTEFHQLTMIVADIPKIV
jgi:hypothetical protein